MIIVVMGVEGAGKTTIGSELARRLKAVFEDADSYHPAENVRKMSAGIPLTDEDRLPWLRALHQMLLAHNAGRQDVVLACSALKQKYRDMLADELPVTWIYLKTSPEELARRITSRHGHYAHQNLLASQLQTLEEPRDALTIDADRSPESIVTEILAKLPQR